MNEAEGDVWHAGRYSTDACFVSAAGADLIEWLAPRPGERILDLGCGDGELGRRIEESGAGVTGIDASQSMVEAACGRGLDARQGRAEALEYCREFDAVFSNAALHWVPQADAVLAGVARALRPAGRLVVEQGGAGNIETVRRALAEELAASCQMATDLSDVWYFPEPEAHAERLRAAGFEVEKMILFERPTPIGGSLEKWLQALAGPVLARLPREKHAGFMDRVSQRAAPALRSPDGSWILDYVRLRYRARLVATS